MHSTNSYTDNTDRLSREEMIETRPLDINWFLVLKLRSTESKLTSRSLAEDIDIKFACGNVIDRRTDLLLRSGFGSSSLFVSGFLLRSRFGGLGLRMLALCWQPRNTLTAGFSTAAFFVDVAFFTGALAVGSSSFFATALAAGFAAAFLGAATFAVDATDYRKMSDLIQMTRRLYLQKRPSLHQLPSLGLAW